ncbi:hypothetical protein GJU92_01440 [Brucella sp. 10RB9213]|nr:hypothetical protein [Brucella sp. 10RB9213]
MTIQVLSFISCCPTRNLCFVLTRTIIKLQSRNAASQQSRKAPGAVPVSTQTLKPLYLFVLSHYPTQNRFALLLEML